MRLRVGFFVVATVAASVVGQSTAFADTPAYYFNAQQDTTLPANLDASLNVVNASVQVMPDLDTIQTVVTFANKVTPTMFLPKAGSSATPLLKLHFFNPTFGAQGDNADFAISSSSVAYGTTPQSAPAIFDVNPLRGPDGGTTDASSCSPKTWQDPTQPYNVYFSFSYGCSELPQKILFNVVVTGDSSNPKSSSGGIKTFPTSPLSINFGNVAGMRQPQFISGKSPDPTYLTPNSYQTNFQVTSTAPSTFDFTSLTPNTCNFQDPHSGVVTMLSGGTCTATVVAEMSRTNDESNTITLSFQILSQQQSQDIQAQLPSSISLDNPKIPYVATTSAGLPVTLVVGNSSGNICSVDSNAHYLIGEYPGTCSITLSNPGNAQYLPVSQQVQITVTPKSQVGSTSLRIKQKITFVPPSGVTSGKSIRLNLSADSGLPLVVQSTSPKVCTFVNLGTFINASLMNSGTCSFFISQPGNNVFLPVSPIATSFVVGKGAAVKPGAKK